MVKITTSAIQIRACFNTLEGLTLNEAKKLEYIENWFLMG